MHTIIKMVKLRDADLAIVKVDPPADSYLAKIDAVWKRGMQGFGAYVTNSLAGKMLAYTHDLYLFGELNGEIVAWMGYITPRNAGDVGTLGFVHTQPEHRKKGISSVLLRATLDEFEKSGGIALHLATRNPIAHDLYQKHGFQDLGTPTIMRHVTKGVRDFECDYYAYNGKASVRGVHWGDIPRLESLYSVPVHPWHVRDYPRGVWQGDRKCAYEVAALNIMELEGKQRGAAMVMENDRQRVVGCASLIVNEAITGGKSADFDLFVMPAYFAETPALIKALATKAQALEIKQLEIWVFADDGEKLAALKSAGFIKRGAKTEVRLDNKTEMPMELYGASVG